MSTLPPLRFRPILRRYLWGGRRLGSLLGKELGPEPDYAESWEVVDHGADQSVVAAGPWQGTTLRALVEQHARSLFGRHAPPTPFPLLAKFLDAHQVLSVQVHPDDARAARLQPPDLGKTEAWVVLHADPGAMIYAGLQPGVDRTVLAERLAAGQAAACLHRFEPRAGECVFLPAGTVHALGAGLVVAEIQQASDTTFRLFDWNRVGPDGRFRPLHIAAGLDAIDFARGPVQPQSPEPTGTPGVERLVACDKFVLDRRHVTAATTVGGDDRFHLLVALAGRIRVAGDPSGEPLVQGQTMLLPASLGQVGLQPVEPAVVLEVYLP